MIVKLIRFGRRQLHTIISRETIKPSSPTPSHIPRYNLSSLDQLYTPIYMPLIFFYPNNSNCSLTTTDKVKVLKNSLSQSLTRYYPFAGRLLTPKTPYIECNDEGVEFVEAEIHSRMDSFQLHDPPSQLFVDGLIWYTSTCTEILLRVQLNHFSCGGIALAVSMSHVIGDACTLGSFVCYWASVARYGSIDHKEVLQLNPHIIHFPHNDSIQRIEAPCIKEDQRHVVRKFVFPNSILSELKNKVMADASTLPVKNPTRLEVLTSLLYKTAIKATTTKQDFFEPSYLLMLMDTRKMVVPKLPQTTIGNFWTYMMLMTKNETTLDAMVAEIKKEKARLAERVQNMQQVVENIKLVTKKLGNEDYNNVVNISFKFSSICGFPYNKVDFGWGKPIKTTVSHRFGGKNVFLLMDTLQGDGIELTTLLEKEEMEIFENDKEMVSFCESS